MARKDPPSLLKESLDKYKATLEGRQKYVKNEFQAFGLQLAEELADWKNRSLYIRLAKQVDRTILEKALYFVKDQNPGAISSKARLFMWKLKELRSALNLKK